MNMKRTAPFFAAFFAGSLLAGAAIDNSALMPPYKPDAEVVMEKDAEGGETPDWIKSLIIVELRIHSASTDGTVKGLLPGPRPIWRRWGSTASGSRRRSTAGTATETSESTP